MARILIACEESQAVTKAFRKLGHEAFSCDILPCSGGHPEWHYNIDVFDVIENKGGKLQNGEEKYVDDWDLMIAHPPCTYLSVSGARWYYHPDDKHLPTEERRPHPSFPNRAEHREEAVEFFMKLAKAPINHVAVENPVSIISTRWRKPDQIIHPYQFGDPFEKRTCLWIKGLPTLNPTNEVEPPKRKEFKSGTTMPAWYADAWKLPKDERAKLRSKTFPGIAQAMANQWHNFLMKTDA